MATGDGGDASLLRVSAVIGNRHDGDWPATLAAARIDVLELDAADAQRSRHRTRSAHGRDVALGLDRGVQLRDGDVLDWNAAGRTALIARVDLGELLVIDLSGVVAAPETVIARAVEVGHAVGNQHWPAVVRACQVFVPLAVSREAMDAVLAAHLIEGVRWWFARGAEVLPQLTPDEARLLFACGADGHSHLSAGHSRLSAGRGDEETR